MRNEDEDGIEEALTNFGKFLRSVDPIPFDRPFLSDKLDPLRDAVCFVHGGELQHSWADDLFVCSDNHKFTRLTLEEVYRENRYLLDSANARAARENEESGAASPRTQIDPPQHNLLAEHCGYRQPGMKFRMSEICYECSYGGNRKMRGVETVHTILDEAQTFLVDPHDWVECKEGTFLSNNRPFKFCGECDLEIYLDTGEVMRPGIKDHAHTKTSNLREGNIGERYTVEDYRRMRDNDPALKEIFAGG